MHILAVYKIGKSHYTGINPRGRDEPSLRINHFWSRPPMSTSPARILVVDDDPGITEQLSRVLEKAGWLVTIAVDGEQALELITQLKPDLVLLDIQLPKLDGRLVLLTLRKAGDQTPVIMLTRYGDIADEIVGFELGADDYIGKPFRSEVVVARIRAVLRRTRAKQPSLARSPKLCHGDLILARQARRAYLNGRDLKLSPKDFALLECLMLHPDERLSRSQLLDDLGWDDPRLIDHHVALLRKALGDQAKLPKYIETVHTEGYRFIGPVGACE
jgi:DNA-binding response OmpR family regulator